MQGLSRWLFPSLLGSFLMLSPSQEKEPDEPMVELKPIQPIQFEYVQPMSPEVLSIHRIPAPPKFGPETGVDWFEVARERSCRINVGATVLNEDKGLSFAVIYLKEGEPISLRLGESILVSGKSYRISRIDKSGVTLTRGENAVRCSIFRME